jgi:branched-subunit amino acid ABC-type transport system permease component
MADIPQLVLNGLTIGGIYALGGVGLTLVYGILNLVNFAHGDFLTAGAYLAWTGAAGYFGAQPWQIGAGLALILALVLAGDQLESSLRTPDRIGLVAAIGVLGLVTVLEFYAASMTVTVLASLVFSAAGVAVLGLGLDRVLWTRMRDRDANLLTLMIVSIGLAFALRSTLQLIYGGDIRVFFEQAAGQNYTVRYYLSYLGLGHVRITDIHVWIIATSAVAALATTLVMKLTRVGKAMRALSDNEDLARVAGIDVERVVAYVWVVGGVLAGLAGTLLAMNTTLHGTLGWRALLPLFAAVILGGVGSVPGAMLGGMVIGLGQELSVPLLGAIGLSTSYKVAVGFLILIVTLLVRPQGLMGVEQ